MTPQERLEKAREIALALFQDEALAKEVHSMMGAFKSTSPCHIRRTKHSISRTSVSPEFAKGL